MLWRFGGFVFIVVLSVLLIFEMGPAATESGKRLLGRGNENGIAYSAMFPFSIHPVKVSLCLERKQDGTEPCFHTGCFLGDSFNELGSNSIKCAVDFFFLIRM